MGCCLPKPVSKYPRLEETSPRPRRHRGHIGSSQSYRVKQRRAASPVLRPTERTDSLNSGSYSSVRSVSSLGDNTSESQHQQVHTVSVHNDPESPVWLKPRPKSELAEVEAEHGTRSNHTSPLTTVTDLDTDNESLSLSLSSSTSSLSESVKVSSATATCTCTPNDASQAVNDMSLSVTACHVHGEESKGPPQSTSKPRGKRISKRRSTASVRVCESDLPILLEVLADYAHKWREIGQVLGFSSNELDVIASEPKLFVNAPKSWLAEMLRTWVQWTPQTQHAKHPILRDLLKALRSKMVGLAAVAEKVKKAMKGAAKRKPSEDSVDGAVVSPATRELKPPDCSAPALEHYAYYLRVYFTCNREPADKWPEIEAKEYIRLAVVGNEYGRADLEEFREATIHGSIDDILKSKAPFEFIDLLKSNFVNGKKHPIRRVLLEGAPGIGKSTMSWEVCRKWGNGELFQEYSLVVMLRFRDSWVQKVKSLSDLFRFPGEPEMQQEVAKQIKRMQGKGVLFILEGFDEAPPSLRKIDSLFFELFKGTLLPNATVMVTTRPSASYDLQRCCKGESSRRIEVLGFGKKEIKEYVDAHFSQGTLPVEDFYRYLELYPHIYSMMYVPLNSAIVTHVYQMCKSTSTIVPQTMTQLYTALIKTLLLRYLKEIVEYQDITIKSFNDLPIPVLQKFQQICKLAYEGLTKPEKEIIFSGLPKDFDSLGLMQSVSELYIDEGASVSHNFLHLTFQEYLTAYYLSTLSEDKQVNFLTRNLGMQLEVQLSKFFAGLCELNPSPLCKALEMKRKYMDDGIWLISMFEADLLFELHSPPVLTRLFKESLTAASQCLDYNVVFDSGQEYDLTLFGSYALSYVILYSGAKWKIILQNPSNEIDLFSKGMSMHQPQVDQSDSDHNPGVNVTELFLLYENCNEIMRNIKFFPNLQCLDIKSWNRDYLGDVSELVKSLHKLQNLTTLNLLHSDFEMDVQYVEEGKTLVDLLLSPAWHCLQDLNVRWKITLSEIVQYVIDTLSENTISPLKKLDFSGSALNISNVESLATLLKVNTNVTTLNVSHCNLGSHGVASLAKSVEVNTALKSLDLSRTLQEDVRSPHATSTKPHVDALCSMLLRNRVLVELILQDCLLTEQGCILLAESLQTNTVLKSLDLGQNSIGDVGAIALAKALESNSTLTTLYILRNSISDAGAVALAKTLKRNSTLTSLYVQQNSIGNNGAIAFAKVLKNNRTLKCLSLANNKVDKEGKAAFAKTYVKNPTLHVVWHLRYGET